MFDLARVQAAVAAQGLDGWLLYDFRGSNVLARRVMEIPADVMGSRRCLYWIPASGTPLKLVHRIESGALDHLPGDKTVYLSWQSFEAGVAEMVRGCQRVAMEYSPRNAIPYFSRVDAGTVELVRSCGPEVVPSADLIQLFEAVWDADQWAMHRAAEQVTTSAYDLVWNFIAREVRANGQTTEIAVRDLIMDHFKRHGLTTYHPPIVGVNAHSGDPHYETGQGDTGRGDNCDIREGDFVLVDLWAKLDKPRSVYSDLTRTGFVGTTVPEKYDRIFQVVAAARDAAIERVRTAFEKGERLEGWQVDEACRQVIVNAGYGDAFVHRTGHSIGQEVHGNGANMDNLETQDTREVIPGTCFSVEPGIYLPEFGVRSEVNVYVDHDRQVYVTGGELQREVVAILSR